MALSEARRYMLIDAKDKLDKAESLVYLASDQINTILENDKIEQQKLNVRKVDASELSLDQMMKVLAFYNDSHNILVNGTHYEGFVSALIQEIIFLQNALEGYKTSQEKIPDRYSEAAFRCNDCKFFVSNLEAHEAWHERLEVMNKRERCATSEGCWAIGGPSACPDADTCS